MTPLEAREILLLLRPGINDEEDPEMTAALGVAAQDPNLTEWLKENRGFHVRVRQGLRSILPPAELKADILKAAQNLRSEEEELPDGKIISFPWKWTALLAVAAAVAMLLFVSSLDWKSNPDSDNSFSQFRARMARTAVREYKMDLVSSNLTEIQRYLAVHSPLGRYTLPTGLSNIPAFGCAALRWHNQPVSMICFKRTSTELVWLFIIDPDSLVKPPPASIPQFEVAGKLMTASWTSDRRTYVLGVIGDKALLQKYL